MSLSHIDVSLSVFPPHFLPLSLELIKTPTNHELDCGMNILVKCKDICIITSKSENMVDVQGKKLLIYNVICHD